MEIWFFIFSYPDTSVSILSFKDNVFTLGGFLGFCLFVCVLCVIREAFCLFVCVVCVIRETFCLFVCVLCVIRETCSHVCKSVSVTPPYISIHYGIIHICNKLYRVMFNVDEKKFKYKAHIC
jgi:hypothetical protein